MPPVFLITSGEYSGYHVDAAFSTLEKAEAFVALFGKRYGIEEYDLDEYVSKIDRGYVPYIVSMETNTSNVLSIRIDDYDADDRPTYINDIDEKVSWRDYDHFDLANYKRNFTPKIHAPFIEVSVWAKDETSAIKIASEQRAMWLANTPRKLKWIRVFCESCNDKHEIHFLKNSDEVSQFKCDEDTVVSIPNPGLKYHGLTPSIQYVLTMSSQTDDGKNLYLDVIERSVDPS